MHLTHPLVQNGWFTEINAKLWPGQAMAIKVNQILHVEKSAFQDILVFESTDYGNVLVLDGCIQVTERDEFSYQEMITHLAMMNHKNPKRVLVVGGGDGGVLREVVKHDIDEVTLVDIDDKVIQVSKKFLPSLAVGFQHPKTNVVIMDGFEFLQQHQESFDVVITDSSDPEGPAEKLFEREYFELLNNALKSEGVMTMQAECVWLHLDLIKQMLGNCKRVFPRVEYAYTTIPTYPSGQIGFMVCSKDIQASLVTPLRELPDEEELERFRYYNKYIHRASFTLPAFAKRALQ